MPEHVNSNAEGTEGLSHFLERFLNQGEAAVAAGGAPPVDDRALGVLAEWEQNARLELAGDPPEFISAAAGWAAIMVYDACRFVVCRDVSAEEVAAAFARKPPVARSPAVDWSVDVVLRQLPEVFRLARHLSPNDPLVKELQALAAVWPLSSVGITGLENLDLDSFIGHPALRQLYADRILAAEDVSRLGAPRCDAVLREALGAYHELSPTIARRLFPEPPAPSHRVCTP